jgi:hypothetical protein
VCAFEGSKMSQKYEQLLPYDLAVALEDLNLELLEVQADILELVENIPDYVARLPYTTNKELH